MNYGMQLAASGALTGLYRMDVWANNLANLSTTAFKPDIPSLRQRDPASVEDGLGLMPSNRMLERLGGGVMAAPNRVNFEQGSPEWTGNDFDVAIQGEGFFVLRDEADSGGDRFRLTRDGRFLRDARGRLVSATTGLPVMDISNRAIVLADDAPVQIEPGGVVRQGGQVVAKIQLTAMGDKTRLSKLGHSMFLAPADLLANRQPASGQIQQRYKEGSAVDPIAALLAVTDAQRAVEGASRLIQGHDRLMDRAINGLGRVA
jgi:flagellar basal body rod protein FlgG